MSIKEVTMFESRGRKFSDLAKAERWEAYNDALDKADAVLRSPVDKGCDFANGGGYIQQTPTACAKWLTLVTEAANKFESSEVARMWNENPRGFVGRYLDDGDSPLYRSWVRVQRIDGASREWGQIYYANNPPSVGEWPTVTEPSPSPLQ